MLLQFRRIWHNMVSYLRKLYIRPILAVHKIWPKGLLLLINISYTVLTTNPCPTVSNYATITATLHLTFLQEFLQEWWRGFEQEPMLTLFLSSCSWYYKLQFESKYKQHNSDNPNKFEYKNYIKFWLVLEKNNKTSRNIFVNINYFQIESGNTVRLWLCLLSIFNIISPRFRFHTFWTPGPQKSM